MDDELPSFIFSLVKALLLKSIILIAISLIKQSWWLVLKSNFQRIQKENAKRNSFIEALENEKNTKEREELIRKNNGWTND